MPHIVFLGPPGAGKGTQAKLVCGRLGIAHLSTGDILRAAVAAGTPLGREADGHMRAGRLVPDELVLKILTERLQEPDTRSGFLLDGFPRTGPQAVALEAITPIDLVVSFEIPESVLVERLSQRRVCPKCGTLYNLATKPPKRPGLCDLDGATLDHRTDDRAEAVATRLKTYAEKTAPLLEHYRKLGLLKPVDASGSTEDVEARLWKLLGPGR